MPRRHFPKLSSIIVLIFILIICQDIYAYYAITISEFTITITKVEASYDSGSSWRTIYDSSTGTTINLNSVDINSLASSFPLATGLPSGTINKVKVTTAGTASFTGFSYNSDGGGTYYYHAAQTVSYNTLINANCSTSGTAPTNNKVTITDIPDSVRIATFDVSINIPEGKTTIKLNINLTDSLYTNYSDRLYANPLTTIGSIGT